MRRQSGAVVAAIALAALTACAGPDLSPVPTTAASPYACDGVPLESAELIAGEPLEVSVANSGWGTDGVGFSCSLVGENTLVQVQEIDVKSSPFGPSEESVLASMRSSGGVPIDADAPGSGYVWGQGDVTAWWVCDGRLLRAVAAGDTVEGRDRTTDVTRLLESMLPWACEEQDVPAATSDE